MSLYGEVETVWSEEAHVNLSILNRKNSRMRQHHITHMGYFKLIKNKQAANKLNP